MINTTARDAKRRRSDVEERKKHYTSPGALLSFAVRFDPILALQREHHARTLFSPPPGPNAPVHHKPHPFSKQRPTHYDLSCIMHTCKVYPPTISPTRHRNSPPSTRYSVFLSPPLSPPWFTLVCFFLLSTSPNANKNSGAPARNRRGTKGRHKASPRIPTMTYHTKNLQ